MITLLFFLLGGVFVLFLFAAVAVGVVLAVRSGRRNPVRDLSSSGQSDGWMQ